MGKHSKQKKRQSNRKKILTTGAMTVGLLLSQTSAYASVDQKPQTESIQSIVEKSGIVATPELNKEALIVAPVTASKDATVSFEKPVIKATPSPERIAEENRVKAAEAAKIEADKQAVIKAEADKVAEAARVAEAAKAAEAAEAARVAQAQKATQTGYAPAQSYATKSGANTGANAGSSAPVSGKQAAILAAARAQLGVAQDCTMLVTNSLKAVGINFHDWPAGYLSLGPVTNTPEPGDLIYYVNGGSGMAHIAVYAGNGKAIHGGFNGNSTVEFSANVGSGPVYISMR